MPEKGTKKTASLSRSGKTVRRQGKKTALQAARKKTGAPQRQNKPPAASQPYPTNFTREIPAMYNETYLRVLPRDPQVLFSFWEVAPRAIEDATGSLPKGPAEAPREVLRLYEVQHASSRSKGEQVNRPSRPAAPSPTELPLQQASPPPPPPPARLVGDLPIAEGTHSHYIRVPEAGRTYRLQLGVEPMQGQFIPLCQSNDVAMPAGRVHRPVGGRRAGVDTQRLIDFSLRSGAFNIPVRQGGDEILDAAVIMNTGTIPAMQGAPGNSGVQAEGSAAATAGHVTTFSSHVPSSPPIPPAGN